MLQVLKTPVSAGAKPQENRQKEWLVSRLLSKLSGTYGTRSETPAPTLVEANPTRPHVRTMIVNRRLPPLSNSEAHDYSLQKASEDTSANATATGTASELAPGGIKNLNTVTNESWYEDEDGMPIWTGGRCRCRGGRHNHGH